MDAAGSCVDAANYGVPARVHSLRFSKIVVSLKNLYEAAVSVGKHASGRSAGMFRV